MEPNTQSAQITLELYHLMNAEQYEVGEWCKMIKRGEGSQINDRSFKRVMDFLELVACYKLDGCLAENHFRVLFEEIFEKLDGVRVKQHNGDYPNIWRIIK